MNGKRPLFTRERVLILGSTGWLGRTAVELVTRDEPRDALLISRSRQRISVGGVAHEVSSFEWRQVQAFAPSIVLNFAFLTREKVEQVGLARFIEENEALTNRLAEVASLPSVHTVVTISSGVAVTNAGASIEVDPYAALKGREEALAAQLTRPGCGVVVGRAWSLSGPHVQRPMAYAFSNLIVQALQGQIRVHAEREVWRRYCDAGQFIEALTRSAAPDECLVIDSGGPLVEVRELAQTIAREVRCRDVSWPEPVGAPDEYYSDNHSWRRTCAELGIQEMGLTEQIDGVVAALARIGSAGNVGFDGHGGRVC